MMNKTSETRIRIRMNQQYLLHHSSNEYELIFNDNIN